MVWNGLTPVMNNFRGEKSLIDTMNIQLLRLIAVGLAVVLSLLVPGWLAAGQLFVSVALILLLGLPHGATDYVLTRADQEKPRLSQKWWLFTIAYLGIMALYAVAWYFFPVFSFYLFIGFTIFHFGQSNWWELSKYPVFRLTLSLVWGSFVLLAPILFHYAEAATIIAELLGPQTPQLSTRLAWGGAFGLFGLSLLGIFMAARLELINPGQTYREIRQLVLLLILFWVSPLLIGFTLYFTLWHSHDAADAQIRFLRFQSQGRFNWFDFGKKAFPLTALAIFGLLLWYLGLEQFLTVNWQLSWLFVFISLVSLPHVVVMDGFYERLRATKSA